MQIYRIYIRYNNKKLCLITYDLRLNNLNSYTIELLCYYFILMKSILNKSKCRNRLVRHNKITPHIDIINDKKINKLYVSLTDNTTKKKKIIIKMKIIISNLQLLRKKKSKLKRLIQINRK